MQILNINIILKPRNMNKPRRVEMPLNSVSKYIYKANLIETNAKFIDNKFIFIVYNLVFFTIKSYFSV